LLFAIRTNEELNNLDQNVDTVTDVKLRRLEWLGHLIIMESNKIPKIVLDAKLDGKRKAGRPELRWLNDVQADVKVTGSKGWRNRNKTQDRS
jgi:hypothetical protein